MTYKINDAWMGDGVWARDSARQLTAVLTKITNEAEMRSFLADLLTEKEIVATSTRLEVARLLALQENYADIVRRTGLSSRTVARISAWYKSANYGYPIALKHLGFLPDSSKPGAYTCRS